MFLLEQVGNINFQIDKNWAVPWAQKISTKTVTYFQGLPTEYIVNYSGSAIV